MRRRSVLVLVGFAASCAAALLARAATASETPHALTTPLAFPPGTRYAYSNTNDVLLGMAVEAAARAPLAGYEREHLFAPAGMTQTTLSAPPPDTAIANGYSQGDGWLPVKPYLSRLYACGDGVSIFPFAPDHVRGSSRRGARVRLRQRAPSRTAVRDRGARQRDRFRNRADQRADPRAALALTARFRAFFEALQRGKVNRDELTDAMNAQLTATALPELAAQLAPLGALRSLVYLGKTEQPLGTAFRYTGIFARGDRPLTFSLDNDGKIAGVVTR